MQTRIDARLLQDPEISEAESILRSCVHCGFCTAVCPTYQLLGDELDGPRGRIYLIRDMLQTQEVSTTAVRHIDRCLTCRACETVCPSGVQYGRLVDIGRSFMAARRRPGMRSRIMSWLLRQVVPRPRVVGPLLGLGRMFRPFLPAGLRSLVPAAPWRGTEPTASAPLEAGARQVVVLAGCVQRAATPGVNQALAYLLGQHGIGVTLLPEEGCCGALDYHLGAHEAGLERMRLMIDRLLPLLDHTDAIVSTASGCGVAVKDYPVMLAHDPEYKARASAVADKCVDASELLVDLAFAAAPVAVACHIPCTLQHGQRLPGLVPQILRDSGLELLEVPDAGLCCGSAGTYSILQPGLARQLRDKKVRALLAGTPEVIVTANIGCQLHLAGGTEVPVMHWLELLANQVRLLKEPPE